ncbi:glutamate receptor ionotropic, kainate 2-like [Physella acuta]|uniref:glutamate receptor ionotropic, kainate 2-like n=1 Tax=Physella acuta TaxID=109671 RepID=UPI0027DBA226|nr:glutamate receptor ionotropic, kainate 2-like [Physella acuta]
MTSTHWKRLSTLVIGLALVHCARCLPELLKLGGLFGEGDEHASIENAFRFAVYRINHDRQLLANTKLTYDIQSLSVTDGFGSAKKVCSQIDQHPIAVFGPRAENLAAFVNSMCAAMQIPHLEMRNDARDGHHVAPHGLNINLYPGIQQIAHAYTDLIAYYGWTQMLVVYGSTYGLSRVQRVLRGEIPTLEDVLVRHVDASNMRLILREAKDKRWRRMLIDLPVDETTLFLKMALQEGMIDPYHHYIVTNLDIESIDMEDFRHNYVNLTGFRLVDPSDPDVRKIIHEMEIYEMQTDLSLLNTTGYLSLPHEVALMYDSVYLLAVALDRYDKSAILRPFNASCDSPAQWTSGPILYSFLNQIPLKGLTGDILLKTGRRLDFKLDILQLASKGLMKGGEWRLSSGINVTSHEHFMLGNPFGNKTLVVTSLKEAPFLMDKENPTPDEPYEGFCIDLAKELAKIVGFNFRIELVPDGNYGSPNAAGEWDGMVREIIERRADLAIAPLTITYIREQVIDFTKPFLNLGISILFKVPRKEKPGLFSFLNPLAIEIWLYVIGAYLIVSFTIFTLARFSPYEWYNPHPCNPNTDEVLNTFNLSNSFWFTVGTLMQQGSDINPRAVSTRIVGGIWWFFTLIIISSYTANLAAFLTVERMVSPIENAEDLSRQTDIEYGTRVSSSTFSFFKDSNIDTYKRMYAYMKDRPHVLAETYAEGIAKVKRGNYAFFMENLMIDYQVQRNCDLMQVGGQLDSKGYGIGLPMNSPYRDKLSMAILELQEGGKIQMLYNKWWKDTGSCIREDTKESKANALGVENVGGIFVVLLVGLALAVVVAIIEFIYKSKENAYEDKESLCTEMAQELRFAIRCSGASKRPKNKFKSRCQDCRDGKAHSSHAHHIQEIGPESPNGVIQLRAHKAPSSVPSSTRSAGRRVETEFRADVTHTRDFNGDYQHVDYSDNEV